MQLGCVARHRVRAAGSVAGTSAAVVTVHCFRPSWKIAFSLCVVIEN